MLTTKEKATIAFYLFLVGLSGAFLIYASNLRPGRGHVPGPAAFPQLASYLLIVLAFLGMWAVIKNKGKDMLSTSEVDYHIVFILLGLTIAFAFLIYRVGFFYMLPPYIFAILVLLGVRKWLVNFIFTTSFTLTIYYLFGVLLKVPFPRGTFWY